MEHDGQPALIKRIFGMVATDKQLSDKLALALENKQQWPRDMAGVLMRLHAAAAAGELRGMSAAHKTRLDMVVESIWAQFEGRTQDLDPHYWGAFYSQVLVAWLCAWRSGMSSEALAEAVRRAGRALIAMDAARGKNVGVRARVRERMHEEYVGLAHVPVWGAQEKDIVHVTFYGRERN